MRKLLCAIALSLSTLATSAQTTTSKTLVLVGEYTINGFSYVNNCTVQNVRDTMFTHPDNFSVSDALAESSYGKYNLIGDVHGPYRVNANDLSANGATLNCGAYSVVSNRMKTMAQAEGVQLSQYDRFVYVLPFQAGCSAASGQAISLQGNTNIAGREHWVFDCQSAMTYEHEIGHTLVGSGHSNDDFDPMHNWNNTLRMFNAVAALRLNWIAPEAVQNVNGNGRYYLGPLNLTRAQTSLPQIYLLTTPQNTYALSYRQPYGVDRNLGTWSSMSRLRINHTIGPRDLVTTVGLNKSVTLDGVTITTVGASPANLAFDIGGTSGPPNPENPPQPSCTPNATTLCLRGGRFSVTATWKNGSSNGPAQAIPFSNDTGYFWFFGSTNVELAVKVLDGTTINNRFWVFYGGLTNLEYTITVTDLWNNVTETYTNIAGSVCGGADTAFGLMGASTSGTPPAVTSGIGAPVTCTADPNTLCLQPGGDTIKVEATYQGGGIAQGGLLPNTAQGGYFTFFSPSNVEQLVKVLDARSFNQRYWVFTGALSDVAYTVTFTNTRSGRWVKVTNPAGNYCGSATTHLLY